LNISLTENQIRFLLWVYESNQTC